VIDVNLYDEIDFICPHYPPPPLSSSTDSEADNRIDAAVVADDVSRSLEYYVVYQVSACVQTTPIRCNELDSRPTGLDNDAAASPWYDGQCLNCKMRNGATLPSPFLFRPYPSIHKVK